MNAPVVRRNNTVKIPRKPGLEIHVSALTLFPGEDDERAYLEIREWNTEAEIYGHGILIPMVLTPDLQSVIDQVVGAL